MAIYKVNGVEVDPREQHTLPYTKTLPVGYLDDKLPTEVSKYGISYLPPVTEMQGETEVILTPGKWMYQGAEVVLPLAIPRATTFQAGELLKYDENSALGGLFAACGITIEPDPAPTAPAAPTAEELLAQAKATKLAAFRNKTRQMLAAGFTHSGIVFGAEEDSETRWMGLGTLLGAEVIVYPQPVYGLDGTKLDLNTKAEVQAFLGAAAAYIEGTVRNPIRDKVTAVENATTVAAVDAITDPRS